MKFLVAALVASASLVLAQNQTFPCLTEPELDAKVPACAQACQHAALAADGCPYNDVGCHCLKTGFLGSLLVPCLSNSTCTLQDLEDLDNLINPVCAYFNATYNGAIPKASCSSSSSWGPPPPTGKPGPPGGNGWPATSTSTYWAKPTTGWGAPGNATNATAPVKYWGNGASSVQILGSSMLVVVGGVAALLL